MQYGEVENYFTVGDFEGLLLNCQEIFGEITELSQQFATDTTISNPEAVKEIMMKLTGCYNSLKIVHIVSDTTKKKEELIFFNNRKMEVEGEGKKFTAASGTKEASAHAQNYRRIRNVVGAYLDVCDKTISVCQSVLKYAIEEAKLSRG